MEIIRITTTRARLCGYVNVYVWACASACEHEGVRVREREGMRAREREGVMLRECVARRDWKRLFLQVSVTQNKLISFKNKFQNFI